MSSYKFIWLILDKGRQKHVEENKETSKNGSGKLGVHKWKTENRPVLITLLKN